MMFTGPPESAGITTAVLGVNCPTGPGASIISTVQKHVQAEVVKLIVAGPATVGGPVVPVIVVPAKSVA